MREQRVRFARLKGINYLVVTLQPGERWTYQPPMDHEVAWVAIGRGALNVGQAVSNGELAIFEPGSTAITLRAQEVQRRRSSWGPPCPIGMSCTSDRPSVHTSREALATGERNIREIRPGTGCRR